ncbi:hypothetical protein [Eggerthella sinensis]|uniref:hypothetical protein n=1 Tax=Eggerthella sinensis TaxID=242230 RepID=UPI0022E6EEC0|nr:hypothetical protein [Eggerthella sinensis]
MTKCDYLPLNPDFNMEALKVAARSLNPDLEVFATSARTGEGIEEFAQWVRMQRTSVVE